EVDTFIGYHAAARPHRTDPGQQPFCCGHCLVTVISNFQHKPPSIGRTVRNLQEACPSYSRGGGVSEQCQFSQPAKSMASPRRALTAHLGTPKVTGSVR